MSPIQKLSDQEQVSEYISKLEPVLAEIIETIRQLFLNVDPLISEHIKWNSPSFYYNGAMKDFDPKTYKRDLAVLNLNRGRIMLVLPTGDKINDHSGLLEGDYKDGRRLINFKDLDDVNSKKVALEHIIKEWIKLIDK
jgi:hypothetical protein